MTKSDIDQAVLIEKLAQASAQQGALLRQTVQQLTMQVLQSRELTVKSIRDVLKTMTQATSSSLAMGGTVGSDTESLLTKAIEGMDAALVQAVEANRRALQQLVDRGVALGEPSVRQAMDEIKQMEDVLFDTISRTVRGGAQSIQGPWSSVLEAVQLKGTATGASATAAIEQLTDKAQGTLRDGQALRQRSVELWMEHYATLVSGVFIGMSEALREQPETARPLAASTVTRR